MSMHHDTFVNNRPTSYTYFTINFHITEKKLTIKIYYYFPNVTDHNQLLKLKYITGSAVKA